MGFHHDDRCSPKLHPRHQIAHGSEDSITPIRGCATDISTIKKPSKIAAVALLLGDKQTGGLDKAGITETGGIIVRGCKQMASIGCLAKLPPSQRRNEKPKLVG